MSKPRTPVKGAAHKPKSAAQAESDADEEGPIELVEVTLRMKPAQRDKLTRLGGTAWIRDRIDKAKIPKE